MDNSSDYEKTRRDAQDFYHSIDKVFSPVFKKEVHFNSGGLNHIIYKRSNTERERTSQIARFNLLHLAVKLVKLSTTYQEFEEIQKEFAVRSNNKKFRKIKPIRYWGIIAIIEGRKIKVILRQVGDNGTLLFWSIIPSWTTSRKRDRKFFKMMKGNPSED